MLDSTAAGKFAIYQSLQQYVGWTAEDAEHVVIAGNCVRSSFAALVDDFYESIRREPMTARMITGGDTQIERLKKTLLQWLEELFSGVYDEAYVVRRWKVGHRHVEIGLRQIYADAAMARLRAGLHEALERSWREDMRLMPRVARSLNRLLDLEIALIEDAYTIEQLVVQKKTVQQQSEATFRQLVEAARCIIVIVRRDHSVAYFSPFAEQITSFTLGDVVGCNYLERFIAPDDRKAVSISFQRIITDGVPFTGLMHPINTRGGEQRSILWNLQRLADYEGEVAVLAVGHDITDLRQAQELVLQSERLAAIGQTVTGLAHESRNAFQRSQACLEMLEVELEGRPDELELVKRIQRALDHLHHLYEEVRHYAAPLVLDRQVCGLTHLWREVWGQLEIARDEKPAELIEESVTADVTANVDRFQLAKVFRNVFENAITACRKQVAVSIAEACVAGRRMIELHVRDDGPGIPIANRKRIFDPFFTTKTKGTGLGMAIAKRIVEAHGGTIQVGNCCSGAEFVITLPAS